MTLLDRILERGVPMPLDPIVAARLERHLRRIQPDPLFRLRLRGQVLNRYVATREGLLPAQTPDRTAGRQMGVLGRGVLYASLLTVLGVTAVGAASQESLPGDALYGVKLQLEDLRMRIAPPGLRDDLAAMALVERLDEVEKLAEGGRWALVDAAADRAAAARDQLSGLTGAEASAVGHERASEAMQLHAERLAELKATAPTEAQTGLDRALDASTAKEPPAVQPSVPSAPPAFEPPASTPAGGAPPLRESSKPSH